MDPARQLSAAYPSPPPYYSLYTDENLASAGSAFGPNLSPPPPVAEPLSVFGTTLDINAGIPALESLGIRPLYASLDMRDRGSELKKLNHSILWNFLELLDLLEKEPGNAQYKVEHIRLLLINFHHLLNDFRPHQARDSLAVMMREQIRRRRDTTAAIRAQMQCARAIATMPALPLGQSAEPAGELDAANQPTAGPAQEAKYKIASTDDVDVQGEVDSHGGESDSESEPLGITAADSESAFLSVQSLHQADYSDLDADEPLILDLEPAHDASETPTSILNDDASDINTSDDDDSIADRHTWVPLKPAIPEEEAASSHAKSSPVIHVSESLSELDSVESRQQQLVHGLIEIPTILAEMRQKENGGDPHEPPPVSFLDDDDAGDSLADINLETCEKGVPPVTGDAEVQTQPLSAALRAAHSHDGLSALPDSSVFGEMAEADARDRSASTAGRNSGDQRTLSSDATPTASRPFICTSTSSPVAEAPPDSPSIIITPTQGSSQSQPQDSLAAAPPSELQDNSQKAVEAEAHTDMLQYEAGALFMVVTEFGAGDLDELELVVGDTIELLMTPATPNEYWWMGVNRSWGKRNGHQGFFPRHHVRPYDPDNPDAQTEPVPEPELGIQVEAEAPPDEAPSSAAASEPEPVKPGTKVVVVGPYEPAKTDELALAQGDLVVVLEAPPGGWWKGMKGLNEKAPLTGWFPALCVAVQQDTTAGKPAAAPGPQSKTRKKNSLKDDDGSPEQQRKGGLGWMRKLVHKDKDKRKRSHSSDVNNTSASSSDSPLPEPHPSAAPHSAHSHAAQSSSMSSSQDAGPDSATIIDPDALVAELEASAAAAAAAANMPAPAAQASTTTIPESRAISADVQPGSAAQSGASPSSQAGATELSGALGGNTGTAGLYIATHSPSEPSPTSAIVQSPQPERSSTLDVPDDSRRGSSRQSVIGRMDSDLDSAPRSSEVHSRRYQRSPSDVMGVRRISVASEDQDTSLLLDALAAPRNRMSVIGKSSSNVRNTIMIQSATAWNPADLMRGATSEKWQERFEDAELAEMSSSKKKRLSATWELLQTERDYVRDLAIIVEVSFEPSRFYAWIAHVDSQRMQIFLKPMTNRSVQAKTMLSIFANIEQILNVNVDFLNQLELIANIENIKSYSDVFISAGERFLCYIPFVANQNAVANKLSSILNSKEVRHVIEAASKNPLLRQLDLGGFLLKPVQRICKYPLLLREMCNHTEQSHPDRPEIERALERMQRVVSTVNESARRMNGIKLIGDVQQRFAEKINIANPNRFLVREDVVYVMFSGFRKSRKLFLFNDIIILARKDWRDKHHVIEKSPLKDVRVSEIIENGALMDGSVTTTMLELEILPTSEGDFTNRYVLATTSIPDKATWLDAYKSLAKHHIKSKQIADVAMTISRRDNGEDDDNGDRASSPAKREPDEEEIEDAVSKALATKTADMQTRLRDAESQAVQHLHKVQELTAVVKEKAARMDELEAKSNALKARITSLESELAAARSSLSARDDTIKQHLESISQRDQSLLDRDERLAATDQRLKSCQADLAACESSIADLSQQLRDKEQLVRENEWNYEQRIAQLEATIRTQATLLSQREAKIEQTETVLAERSAAQAEQSTTIQKLREGISNLESSLAERTQSLGATQQQLESAKSDYAAQTLVLDEARICVAELEQANRSLELELQSRSQDLDAARKMLAETQTRVTELSAEGRDVAERLKHAQQTARERDALVSSLQQSVRESDTRIAQLSEALSAANSKAATRDAAIRDLEAVVVQSNETIRDRDAKIDTIDRQLKDARSRLSEAELALQAAQQRLTQRDLQVADLEGVIREAKTKMSETQAELSNTQSKLGQRDNRLSEAEKELREARTRLVESEAGVAAALQRLAAKETKLVETEEHLTNTQSSLSQLRQRHSEAEQQLSAAHARCADLQSKVKKAEAMLASASSARAVLEQKVVDLKAQLVAHEEHIGKLERDRKELVSDAEKQAHEIASLTRDVRQLREAIKDLKSDHDKAQSQLSASLRDATRELGIQEEKWKGLLDKEKRDHASEYAALCAEFQGYKVSTTAELGRLKADGDANAKQIVKDYEDRLHRLREQSDARTDQIRHSLDHERETAIAKVEEDKNNQIHKLTQSLESVKLKSQQTAESLRRTLQDAQDKLKEREQQLSVRDETLRIKEVEIVRLNMEVKQLAADIARAEGAAEAQRAQFRKAIDELEKSLQDKQQALLRRDSDLGDLSRKLVEANERCDALEQSAQRVQREMDERRRASDDVADRMRETEAALRAEIAALLARVQQIDQAYRDAVTQLDETKFAHTGLAETHRRLSSDHSQLLGSLETHKQQASQLVQERQAIQLRARELSEALERKTQEAADLAAREATLKESVRMRQQEVHESSLRAERAELRVTELERINRTHESESNNLREQLKLEQADAREKLKICEADAHKRLAAAEAEAQRRQDSAIELLRARMASEAAEQLQKAVDQRTEAVSKLQREADAAAARWESEREELCKSVQELTTRLEEQSAEMRQLHGQLAQLSDERKRQVDELIGELEERTKQLLICKKKLKQDEVELVGLRERVQQLSTIRDEMAQQFRELLQESQDLKSEIATSRAAAEALQVQCDAHQTRLGELSDAETQLQAARDELAETARTVKQLESSLALASKQASLQAKQLASVQMAFSEIAKLSGIPPCFPEDEMLEASPKPGKVKRKGALAACAMDNAYLVRVVGAVGDAINRAEHTQELLNAEREKVGEFKELQQLAEQELAAASGAFQAIEERIRQRDQQVANDRDEARRQIDSAARANELLKKEKAHLEAKAQKLCQQLAGVEKEKAELEHSFVQLYERLKNGKEMQAMDALNLNHSIAELQADKERLERQISEQAKQCSILSEKLRAAESERSRQREASEAVMEQRAKGQQLLDAANNTAKSMAFELERCRDQVAHLRDEVQQLRREKADVTMHVKASTDKLNMELARTKEETIRLLSECSVLRESNKERAAQLEKLEEKLTRSEHREIELRDRAYALSEDLKHEKVRAMSLEQDYDQMKIYTTSLESKLQSIQLRTQSAQAQHYTGAPAHSNGHGYIPVVFSQPYPLPVLHPFVSDENDVVPLLSMVEELIAYEPELERQQNMLDRLDKLKTVLGHQPLAPARTLFGVQS
ncbi:Rho guanine nucleotide exchange factor 3 [Polyrhizophydium stewartii]|uniref:Mediator of RNA polymerase II transcription subunit 7 n=1 Tax=Polyrhizophydium stewartii TaxID=2732419 RepID=A0ABR4N7B4_9FUNG